MIVSATAPGMPRPQASATGASGSPSSDMSSGPTLILVENQFSVGDVVRLAGVAGTVEDFNLRRTTVRDIDGVVHTIPNGEIKVASNLTRVWSRINQDVTLAYGTDVDRAIQVVDEVGQAMKADPD